LCVTIKQFAVTISVTQASNNYGILHDLVTLVTTVTVFSLISLFPTACRITNFATERLLEYNCADLEETAARQ